MARNEDNASAAWRRTRQVRSADFNFIETRSIDDFHSVSKRVARRVRQLIHEIHSHALYRVKISRGLEPRVPPLAPLLAVTPR